MPYRKPAKTPVQTLETCAPSTLASLLRPASGLVFTPDELTDLLAHQLAAKLTFGDEAGDRQLRRELYQLPTAEREALQTFGDLFAAPAPPVAVLTLVKDYAKGLLAQRTGVLPSELASVLYLSTIVAAKLRCHTNITRLDTPALCHGIRWALDQAWLKGVCRELLHAGLEKFQAGGGSC